MDSMLPSISDYYRGKEIFLSGGTGFVGKALIEKLLRSCPDIARIFILIRQKHGETFKQRLDKMKLNPIFQPLLIKNPNAFEKIIPIDGNVKALGLGIKESDIKLMENISIVIHASASVRFDDPLKEAILTNVRSTREMIHFAMQLKNLEVFAHISTTFCNADFKVIEEKIYPPHGDWRTAIKLSENFDSYTLDILTKKYTDFMVNTYLYTKGLAESICDEYKDQLPIVIYRPAIITGAAVEPVPGWIDNLNGVVGICISSGLGLMRSMYCSKNFELNCTPVDLCVRGIVSSIWKKAVIDKRDDSFVYNCANGITSVEEMITAVETILPDNPLHSAIWTPNLHCTTNSLVVDNIKTIFLHFFPAYLIDFVLTQVLDQKPRLLKIQRKIRHAQLALRHFATNTWIINNDNYMSLTSHLKDVDKLEFDASSNVVKNRAEYIISQMLYAKRYLLNEDDSLLHKARNKHRRLFILDRSIKALLVLLVLRMALNFFVKNI